MTISRCGLPAPLSIAHVLLPSCLLPRARLSACSFATASSAHCGLAAPTWVWLNLQVKIADFGVARLIDKESVMTAETGTYRWMAPEVIEHKAYDSKADIFSFGIVLWELLTGKVPYTEHTALQVRWRSPRMCCAVPQCRRNVSGPTALQLLHVLPWCRLPWASCSMASGRSRRR